MGLRKSARPQTPGTSLPHSPCGHATSDICSQLPRREGDSRRHPSGPCLPRPGPSLWGDLRGRRWEPKGNTPDSHEGGDKYFLWVRGISSHKKPEPHKSSILFLPEERVEPFSTAAGSMAAYSTGDASTDACFRGGWGCPAAGGPAPMRLEKRTACRHRGGRKDSQPQRSPEPLSTHTFAH